MRASPDSYIDLNLDYRNIHGTINGGVIRQIYLPGDLRFSDSTEAAYLPAYLPGVKVGASFFSNRLNMCRRVDLTYPGDEAFADYAAFRSNGGNLAIYTVNPGDLIQPAIHSLIDDAPDGTMIPDPCPATSLPAGGFDGWYYRHAFQQWWRGGATYQSPTVRLRVGDGALDTAFKYRQDNNIEHGYPSIEEKAARANVDVAALRRAPLVKADLDQYGSNYWLQAEDRERWRSAFSTLPRPSIVHLVALSPGGHDESFPEVLPPDSKLGTTSDLAALIDLARSAGHLVMPYTNPTWWDDTAPTGYPQPLLRRLPAGVSLEDVVVRYLPTEGGPYLCEMATPLETVEQRRERCGYSAAAGHSGYAVSPASQFVVEQIDQQFTRWATIGTRNLIIFEDQVGARRWFFDFADWRPGWSPEVDPNGSAIRFSDGWVAHTATHAAQGFGLSTEAGFDRLARYLLSFHGDVIEKEMSEINAVGEGKSTAWWGATGWSAYPLAPRMFGDKIVFHRHDLSAGPMTDEPPPRSGCTDLWLRTDRLDRMKPHIRHAVAFGTSFSHYGLTCDGQLLTGRWLDLTGVLQQTVGARYAGRLLDDFKDSPPSLESGITRTTFGDLQIDAVWHDRALAQDTHIIPPGGFYARTADGALTAGLFTRLFDHDLAGEHYVFVERSAERIVVHKPVGPDTTIRIPAPVPRDGMQVQITARDRDDRILTTLTLPAGSQWAEFLYQQTVENGTPVEQYVVELVRTERCVPRQPVQVRARATGDGRLEATVVAGTGALVALRFGEPHPLDNALVDVVGGPSGISGALRHALSPGTTQATFFVRRVTHGRNSTVHVTVEDGCGPWPTFVGGGSTAF